MVGTSAPLRWSRQLRSDLNTNAGWSRVAIAVSFVVAVVLTTYVGGAGALLTLLVSAAAIVTAARAASGSADRTFLTTLVVSLFFVRAAGASVLHLLLLRTSPYGAMFFDDSAYMQLADALAHQWRGEVLAPDAQSLLRDSSINSFYVTVAGAIYWLTGSNPLALKLFNNALGVGVALLTYRTSRVLGLPGARIAAGLLLVFPSLALWSVLALKDMFVLFIATAAIWIAAEAIHARRFWLWYAAIAVVLLPLESVRRFFFLILVIAWPLGTFVALDPRRRPWLTVASGAVAMLLLLSTSAWGLFAPRLLSALESTRGAMAQDARTAYVAPPPVVRGSPGDAFTIVVTGQTMPPGETPQITYIAPGTNLVVETRAPATNTAAPSVSPAGGTGAASVSPAGGTGAPSVIVRPGDIVVISTSSSAPSVAANTPEPGSATDLRLLPNRANVIATASPSPPNEAFAVSRDVVANLEAFPKGAAYLIAAPLPWTARSLSELATIPEMITWYSTEALAIVGLVYLVRRRDLRYTYGALVLAGVGFVLILAEGNVGTLLRHRAMIIPETVVLASVGAAVLWRRRQGPPRGARS